MGLCSLSTTAFGGGSPPRSGRLELACPLQMLPKDLRFLSQCALSYRDRPAGRLPADAVRYFTN